MRNISLTDTAQQWASRHPVLMSALGAVLVTVLFCTATDPGLGDLILIFVAFFGLFSLAALNERRRRRKKN
ncbi:hypothetical protein ACWGI1_01635 [Streptomyces sp. NPDC054835]